MSAQVAVVIVSYNSEHDLDELLPLLNDPRLEVTVLDNASSDASLAVARAHEHVDAVAMGSNAGWSVACNEGARRSSAPVLAFVNPDCRVTPEALLELAELVGPGVGAVSPVFRDLDGRLERFAFRFPTTAAGLFLFLNAGQRIDRWLGSPFLRHRTYQHGTRVVGHVDHIGAACMVVDREVFEAVGPFDERMWLFFSDTDWALRARERGLRQVVRDDVVVVHEGGGSVRKLPSRSLSTAFQRDYVTYVDKHATVVGRLITRAGVALLVGLLPALAALARRDLGASRACFLQVREVLR